MGKGNYTHVQKLLPEIKAMLASGKTQREVAEYFGFRDKYVVKRLVSCKDAFQQVCAHVFCRHSKPPSASRGAINSPKESISSTFSQVG